MSERDLQRIEVLSKVGKMVFVGAVEIVDKFYAVRMRLQPVHVADRETLQRFIA